MELTRIPVTGAQPYDVVVGEDLRAALAPALPEAGRVAVVHSAALGGAVRPWCTALQAAGRTVTQVVVPDGERAKTATVLAECWNALAGAGFTRSDAVVGFGGGATTDLAGFVAASWLRGVRVVQVPTTLLGMVDAAVGGKTAIDLPAGKNLVGAFHPPAAVLCDLLMLRSLPVSQRVAGLAEVVKAGFIADPAILGLLESDPAGAHAPGDPRLAELIVRSVAVKAAVVSADLTERGGREMLNYGHTLGHAIEKVEHYTWAHGHAVSVGMMYAARLSALAAGLAEDVVDRHRALLSSLGLPIRVRGDAWPQLREAMSIDKKSRGATLRFVVLDAIGAPRILADPAPELLTEAFREVAA